MKPIEIVNVRYMVDDVDKADRLLYQAPRLRGADELSTGVRRREARQPAAPAQRTDRVPRGGPWRTAPSRDRAAGTAFTSSSTTSRPRSHDCATQELAFRNDIVSGPGGKQILLQDPPATSSSCSNRPPDMSPYSVAVFLHVVGALGLFAAIGLEWAGVRSLRGAVTTSQARSR